MKTLQFEVNIPKDRQLIIQLPDDIEPGVHQLVLVMHPQQQQEQNLQVSNPLQALAGQVTSFTGVDAVSWQRQIRDEWNAD